MGFQWSAYSYAECVQVNKEFVFFMSQNAVRAAGIAALNAWHKEIGLVSFIEGEVIFGALSTENPNLRTEV